MEGKPSRINRTIVKLNNLAVRARRTKAKGEEALIIFPGCLQRSQCDRRVTNNLAHCERCGKCMVGELLKIADEFGARVCCATGGALALQEVKSANGLRGIVAVACERELRGGILGTFPRPVLGIVNLRPHGPCKDTAVDLAEVRKALEWFARGDAENG